MPTRVPKRPRAKVIENEDDFRRHENRMRGGSARHPIGTIDWLALWALSLAFSALFIAGCAFFSEGDVKGAAAVLIGAAAIMAVALGVTKAPDDSR
jgi:hypothetical protein